jgi:hypothetical protein
LSIGKAGRSLSKEGLFVGNQPGGSG